MKTKVSNEVVRSLNKFHPKAKPKTDSNSISRSLKLSQKLAFSPFNLNSDSQLNFKKTCRFSSEEIIEVAWFAKIHLTGFESRKPSPLLQNLY